MHMFKENLRENIIKKLTHIRFRFFKVGLPGVNRRDAVEFAKERAAFYTKNIMVKRRVSRNMGSSSSNVNAPNLWPHSRFFRLFLGRGGYHEIVASTVPKKREIFFVFGDVFTLDTSVPVIVKSYSLLDYDTSSVALYPLNPDRHWSDVIDVERHDIPFEKKMSTCIWRGATTGKRHGQRQKLCDEWFGVDPRVDVGITKAIEPWGKKYVTPTLSMREQLTHKYLIVVEGNDKATSLQWMLYSNSVVMMSEPTIVTWFRSHPISATSWKSSRGARPIPTSAKTFRATRDDSSNSSA